MKTTYTVHLDVRLELEVTAHSADEALEHAQLFQKTMPSAWGTNSDVVIFMDKYLVKQSVSQDLVA